MCITVLLYTMMSSTELIIVACYLVRICTLANQIWDAHFL